MAFERRSYNLVQHRLSLQGPSMEPVIGEYWQKTSVDTRRRSDWVTSSSTNQNTQNWGVNGTSTNRTRRNWVTTNATNQSSRNWVTSTSANQSSQNCVKLPNNKVQVKVANEVHTVTLRRKKERPVEEESPPVQEKKSPIQDILKRFSLTHYRKKKADRDSARRRPRKYFPISKLTLHLCNIYIL